MGSAVLTPTVWVDTNTLLEVFSQGDVYADEHRGPRAIEQRRLLLQGSLWLAMALDEHGTVTGTFNHEFLKGLERLVPSGEDVHMWTRAAFQIGVPYVYPRWGRVFTDAGSDLWNDEDGSNQRDALMVQMCAHQKLHLVTRDRRNKRGRPSPTKLARDAGVPVCTPEDYAQSRLPFETARDRFLERMRIGAAAIVATATSEEQKTELQEAMAQVLDTHEAIWEPPQRFARRLQVRLRLRFHSIAIRVHTNTPT